MTPITCFAGKRVAVFGLGTSGRISAEALIAGGADVVVWDDHRRARDQAAAMGLKLQDLVFEDLSGFDSLVLGPGVPLTHPDSALDRRQGARCGRRNHRRHRTLLPRTRQDRAESFVRCDHRHERQIYDDRARRPSLSLFRLRGRGRRQYRHADPGALAAGSGARPRHRMFFLSDRSRALAQSLRSASCST